MTKCHSPRPWEGAIMLLMILIWFFVIYSKLDTIGKKMDIMLEHHETVSEEEYDD